MKLLLASLAALLLAFGPLAAGPATAQGVTVRGQALEVKDVDIYTYVRIKTAEREVWAAVPKAPVKVGASVTVENGMVMKDFESKTLKRKFDTIVFGNLAGAAPSAAGAAPGAAGPSGPAAGVAGATTGPAAGAATAPGGPAAGAGAAPMAGPRPGAPIPDRADVKVPKATGKDARTVAEIVGKRSELKDKTVTVRGKVVKVTSNVMGKNWVHLRDGTGSQADGTNDVLVTTKDTTQIGDVVVAKGTVRTDVDLGMGYAFKVLVENATLQP
jgi:hypothetical protein